MTKYPPIAFTEIATLIRGVSYDKKVASLSAKDDYIPILRANNIQKDLILNDLVYVPSYLVKEEQMIRKGDIVLAMSSGSKDLVGKSAQANRDIDAAFGTFCGLIRAKEKVDSKFLGLYFQTQEYRNFVSYQSKGVNICNLKKKDIESLQIPLPPLSTQHQIVSRIESLFAELDKAVEHLRTAQQQLKTYRQAVLKSAFEGCVEMVKVKDVCEDIKVGIVIKPSQYYTSSENGIRAFRSANIKEFSVCDSDWVYLTKEGHNENLRSEIHSGDVLVVRSGYPGTACVVTDKYDGCNAIDILIAVPNKNKILPQYLCAYTNSPWGRKVVQEKQRGVAQAHFNVSGYSETPIFLPPLSEQQRIVEEIETRLSQAEAAEASIAEALQKTEALRQSILKKAFSGELV